MAKILLNAKGTIDRIIRKHYVNFMKYSMMGVAFTLYEAFLLWFFVDYLGKSTLIHSVWIVGLSTFFKFYYYVNSGMMKKKFFEYLLVLVMFYASNVVLLLFFVEVLGILASVSSVFLAIAFFVLRFLAYDRLKILNN